MMLLLFWRVNFDYSFDMPSSLSIIGYASASYFMSVEVLFSFSFDVELVVFYLRVGLVGIFRDIGSFFSYFIYFFDIFLGVCGVRTKLFIY